MWVVAGVAPQRRDGLCDWLRKNQQQVRLLDSYRRLPLEVKLPEPDKVGIDRLLNAVAANTRRPPGESVILVDAGTAVTVDWLDETGAFRGGAIFPGAALMAQARAMRWRLPAATHSTLIGLLAATGMRVGRRGMFGPTVPAGTHLREVVEGVFPPQALLDGVLADVCGDAKDVEIVARAVPNRRPAAALLEEAENAELLVVGSRGRGGFVGLLLGSVSQQVTQHARCPVVVVPAHPEGQAPD